MGVSWPFGFPFGFPNWVKPQLDRIEAAVQQILQKENEMAATVAGIKQGVDDMVGTLQQVSNTLAQVGPALDNIGADIKALHDEIGAGGVATQADLEDIMNKLTGASQGASAAQQAAADTLTRIQGMDDPNLPPPPQP